MLKHVLGKNDTLYVIVDGDKCRKNNHLLLPTEITVELTNNNVLNLKGQYCFYCKEVQISRNLCAEFKDYHSLMKPKLFLKGLDDADIEEIPTTFIPIERNEESRLVKYGYSVSQNSRLTNSERQDLLRCIIESKEVSKGYIISYLKHLIAINGKKEGNYSALQKWKNDLEYVLNL